MKPIEVNEKVSEDDHERIISVELSDSEQRTDSYPRIPCILTQQPEFMAGEWGRILGCLIIDAKVKAGEFVDPRIVDSTMADILHKLLSALGMDTEVQVKMAQALGLDKEVSDG
jgi:hypothetical protein